MSVDTAAKRCSAIATRRLPWLRRFAPIPDGSVDAADRQQVAFVYRGIAVTVVVEYEPGQGIIWPVWVRGTSWRIEPRGTSWPVPVRGTSWPIWQRGNLQVKVTTHEKRASDDLTYEWDFTSWPLVASDAIASAVITSTPSGLTIGSAAINSAGTKVQATITGGVAGLTYTVTCTATTTAGRDIVGDGYLEVVAP